MPRTSRRLLALLAAAALAACGSSETASGADDGSADAADTAGDATTDAGDTALPDTDDDAAPDTDDDTAPDTTPDAAPDTAPDTTPDAAPDVVVDADPDVDPDAGDTATDATDAGDVGSDATDVGTDAAPDAADVGTDTAPDAADVGGDTATTEGCGNGVREAGEECDDGNLSDTDACTSECLRARCGDGIVNDGVAPFTLTSPRVENPSGVEGFVCDDGSSCPGGTCDLSDDDGSAPEHGICQALGYHRALSVTWGRGLGAASAPMLHAYNWECDDFACTASPETSTAADCTASQMLARIVCEGDVVEICDDGEANGDEPGACRTDCTPPVCGDAIVDPGEQCDDANDVADDGCDACMRPPCGDGIVQVGEDCDDGFGNSDTTPDACRLDCTAPICGDLVVDSGEECDDGNLVNEDGCSNTCRRPGCGDGIVQVGETCDDGNDIDTDGCTNACELPRCGDGIVNGTDECDDGNDVDTDGCSNTCALPRCGDGVRSELDREVTLSSPVVTEPGGDTGRVCDDGGTCQASSCEVADNGSAPEHGICQSLGYDRAVRVSWGGGAGDADSPMPHAYNWTCTDYVCGDGGGSTGDNCGAGEMLNQLVCRESYIEACDDGEANADAPDACRTDCTLPMCGDGIVDSGEECDDGNDVEDDGCSNRCRLPACGDGVVQAGEGCDDGNEVDTDGCTNACEVPTCGDGIRSTLDREVTVTSPAVTEPGGDTGRVCDDGSSCPAGSCEVADNGSAPEHGICQSLGYDRAVRVSWGGGAGDADNPMPHAFNWTCTDYVCGDGGGSTSDNCGAGEMLNQLVCREQYIEACDEGAGNADVPDTCRTDCTLPRCGDGILDTGEECDDGNDVADDGCSNLCRLPACGDGVVQGGEGCDDGNDIDTDACRNDCTEPTCGDGVVSDYERTQTFASPVVTEPGGASGRVCDDGSSCQASSCEVADNGSAPEHGICQSLGYERAISVSWGGGAGDADNPMPHAFNWTCTDFVCGNGGGITADNCTASEMLNEITCFSGSAEFCDDGAGNADAPDACRTDCTLPRCGDGIIDSGEECDDGNSIADDGCSNVCLRPQCGDGVIQGDELCDDGNDDDTDFCTSACEFGPGITGCGDVFEAVLPTTVESDTTGGPNAWSSRPSPDASVTFVAAATGSVTASTCGGATWDTVIYAYDTTEACGTDTSLGSNDDGCGRQSTLTFPVVAGRAYTVVVEGFNPDSVGAFTLSITAP